MKHTGEVAVDGTSNELDAVVEVRARILTQTLSLCCMSLLAMAHLRASLLFPETDGGIHTTRAIVLVVWGHIMVGLHHIVSRKC